MSPRRRLDDINAPGDVDLLGELRRMWRERDPEPADLVDRITFALALDDLEVELLELVRDRPETELVGHRGEERVRTLMFTGDSLSVMVSITPEPGRVLRIDGWITDGGGLDVELKLEAGTRRERADPHGRFAFDGAEGGLAQLLFHPTESADRALTHTVVTPAVRL
ncbi:MAG: hypothetical protein P8Z68_07115 [Kineosporiaceae bacterium]